MPQKHGGRPREGEEIKRAPLNLRTSPELRQRIEEAADANGYSLTQEVERRLISTFNEEQWMGGPHIRTFVKMLGAAIDRIEQRTHKRWTKDVATWVEVEAVAKRLLAWDRPPPNDTQLEVAKLGEAWSEARAAHRAAVDALDAYRAELGLPSVRGVAILPKAPGRGVLAQALPAPVTDPRAAWTDEQRRTEIELIEAERAAAEREREASAALNDKINPWAQLWREAQQRGDEEAEDWFRLLGPKAAR